MIVFTNVTDSNFRKPSLFGRSLKDFSLCSLLPTQYFKETQPRPHRDGVKNKNTEFHRLSCIMKHDMIKYPFALLIKKGLEIGLWLELGTRKVRIRNDSP